MVRLCSVLGFAAVLTLAAGGCPVEFDPGVGDEGTGGLPAGSTGGGGASTTPSAGTTTSSGTASPDTDDFESHLSEEFPSCAELVAGDALRAEILRLVNVERERQGLPALVYDQTLADQATQYACEMIAYDFFAHVNPVTGSTLSDRAREFGYSFRVIGENLAAGQTTAAQVMADWMASEGHRANILNPDFTELGVGVRTGGRYGTYWVQEFGWPLEQ